MRELSDETTLLREAIGQTLAQATEPMTSGDVYDTPGVRSLGLSPDRVSRELKTMHSRVDKPFPLKRIPHGGPGKSKWAYFNPDVVKLAYTPAEPPRAAPSQGPVNDDKSTPAFEFNPVEFVAPVASPATDTAEPPTPQPGSTVKSITVTVAGISIKIDLDFHKNGE